MRRMRRAAEREDNKKERSARVSLSLSLGRGNGIFFRSERRAGG